ncbi:glycerate kinase, partial [Amylibacter sp.]|nr:glycerate kinase [Amylibacter sp.]
MENSSFYETKVTNTEAHLIAGNTDSVAAMAKEVEAKIIVDPLIGDVNEAVEKILFELEKLKTDKPFAIAFGGETTVKLVGTGKGGRNQELALRFALKAEKVLLNRTWCFL